MIKIEIQFDYYEISVDFLSNKMCSSLTKRRYVSFTEFPYQLQKRVCVFCLFTSDLGKLVICKRFFYFVISILLEVHFSVVFLDTVFPISAILLPETSELYFSIYDFELKY